MNDYIVTIRRLTEESGISFGSHPPFQLIAPIRGWSRADVRTSSTLNSGADGGFIGEQFHGFRQIPINAVLSATSHEEFETLQQLLFNTLPLNEDVEVSLQTPTNKRYVSFARLVNNMDPQVTGPGRCEYGIELLASDPLIYDYTEGEAFEVTVPKRVAGGLLWQSDGLYWHDGGANTGLFWEPGSQGTIINNQGAVDVYPEIVITGSAIDPLLANDTLEEILSFTLTMTATDELVIDMYHKTALLNGMSVFNSLDEEKFWRLAVGVNRIRFETDSPSDTASALVRWRSGYLGAI